MSSEIAVIEAAGLSKSYGRTKALDRFDLRVEAGEVHGFLGPNGAGKTTTLRILLGLLRADRGQVRLLGSDPWSDAVSLHGRVAYVPGDVRLWPSLSGGETVDLLIRLHGGSPKRREEMFSRFELDPCVKVATYSKGNRQKVALVAAFSRDADVYLFDEPTDGLDPLMAHVYRESVAELRAAGRTILLSSHVLAEVEAVADQITIIREGRNVETGSLSELRHLARTYVGAETEMRVVGLTEDPGVHDLSVTGMRLACRVDPDALSRVIARIGAAGLVSLTSRPPTLEELFLRFYSEDEAGTGAGDRPADSGDSDALRGRK